MLTPTHQQLSYLVPAPQENVARLLREAPISDQPLTRLERCGPEVLSSAELLQLVMDSKIDPLLPLRILNQWTTLNELAHASPAELLRIEGMTRMRLARIRAALGCRKK
jgi:DNA repair protein RadC